MKVTGEYQQVWESFWKDVPDEVGGALWDVEPALASALHLPHFEGYFDPGLPVVDLGCGNGTQTRFLAGRYDRVVGADLSREAVARARRADPHGAAGYEVLDAVDREAMRRSPVTRTCTCGACCTSARRRTGPNWWRASPS